MTNLLIPHRRENGDPTFRRRNLFSHMVGHLVIPVSSASLMLMLAAVSTMVSLSSVSQAHVEISDEATPFSAANFQSNRDQITKEILATLPLALNCGSTRLEISMEEQNNQVFVDKKTHTRVLVDLSDKNQIEAYSFSKSELNALKHGDRKTISGTEIAGFLSSDGGHISTSDRSCTLAESIDSAHTTSVAKEP